MGFEHFAGYLGFTSRGVIAIHANWPAYPAEHGWEVALVTLGNFPIGTRFRAIDDIDRCLLFVADGTVRGGDDFSPEAMHIAIWHEDLLELSERQLISGASFVTEQSYEREKSQALPSDLYVRMPSGEYVPVRPPELDRFDDDDCSWPSVVAAGIALTTEAGVTLDILLRRTFKLPPSLQNRVLPMLEAELFDSAVREATVQLESRLREAGSFDAHGVKLVERYIAFLEASGRFRSSYLKVLRVELRTAFRFVRNEFAHSAVELERPRAYALLSRVCGLIVAVDELSSSGPNQSSPPSA